MYIHIKRHNLSLPISTLSNNPLSDRTPCSPPFQAVDNCFTGNPLIPKSNIIT